MARHRPRKSAELYRDGNAYTVLVDLPEFEREDVEVAWKEGRLSVQARRTLDGSERCFDRSFGVPRPVDTSGIGASFEEGVLEVQLPIADDRPGGKQTVEVA